MPFVIMYKCLRTNLKQSNVVKTLCRCCEHESPSASTQEVKTPVSRYERMGVGDTIVMREW